MADFHSWGPIEWKISLGEIANAFAVACTGWYVARIIEKQHANQRALKDLIAFLCRECLDHLAALSQLLEQHSPNGGAVSADGSRAIVRSLQRFSNSIHSIEIAAKKASIIDRLPLEKVKSNLETLRTQIADPLAEAHTLDSSIRQIEGVIRLTRESIIELEIMLHSK